MSRQAMEVFNRITRMRFQEYRDPEAAELLESAVNHFKYATLYEHESSYEKAVYECEMAHERLETIDWLFGRTDA